MWCEDSVVVAHGFSSCGVKAQFLRPHLQLSSAFFLIDLWPQDSFLGPKFWEATLMLNNNVRIYFLFKIF